MGIAEALVSGFSQVISPHVLPYIIIGALFGFVIGVIPGLSGHFAMAMLIPFLYTMKPETGIAFLIGAHSTVAQGGGLTAILFSTPGTGQSAATLMDGPPMTRKGLAGQAVGAAMTACFIGAAFGAVALAFMIPILQKIVLVFGSAEVFMLSFLALTFVSVMGRDDMTRSLIAAFIGLLLAMIGLDNVTNQERFTFGSLHLMDGLDIVPVVLGLFAASEVIDLWLRGRLLDKGVAATTSFRKTQKQIFEGVLTTFKKWWLVLRCSVIGTVIGVIPGLGSVAASFLAYGHAMQTSKSPETFGKGNIEGIIAPESATDAVEGGALASTLAFGIPGSSSMAILLGGLYILGVETGIPIITQHVDLIFVMIFTLIIGTLIGTVVGMFVINPMARLTFLRGSLLVPPLLAVILTGAYAVERSWFDIGIVVFFGIFGYMLKELNYSRASLLIGFVLGHAVEKNLYLAVQLGGPAFFLKPLPLAFLILIILFVGYNIRSHMKYHKKGKGVMKVGN